ncbi:hypothetical protein PHISCL_00489 [Aspergillus sclerotialis]|uniref:Ricin B lectin domain-containing protein n=1 Tax=Aspergillus sclerotialis TaxID=2070753 RepID=A0A3A2ZVR7_9EURO|nr:hypothetical protein PHISCL_00489 [Aspergillus sclerotialis]
MNEKGNEKSDTNGYLSSIEPTPESSLYSLESAEPPAYTDVNHSQRVQPDADTEVVPWAGDTLVIQQRGTGRVIAVTDDRSVRLVTVDNVGTGEGCHWECVEKNGWFGFKHAGRYLGHDNNNFRADARFHRQHENFCVRKHPDGGYQLRNLHRWTFRNMGIGKDGQKLVVAKNDDGALWDFRKV